MKYKVMLYLLNSNNPEIYEEFYCNTEDRVMEYTYSVLNYHKESDPVCLFYENKGNKYIYRGRMYRNMEE